MERAEKLTRRYGGAIVRSSGDSFLASFEASSPAVETSISFLQESYSGQFAARAAVHRGPVLVTTMNGRLDYFGKTVFELRELLDQYHPGELSVSGTAAKSSDLDRFADRMTTLSADNSGPGGLSFSYRYRILVDSGSISDDPQTAISAE